MNEQFADDITLLKLIAKGGMGEVFLGIQRGAAGFERQVAVKRVFKHLANKKNFRAMFEREVSLGSRLQHPNIVQVIQSGERNGFLYYVMEYVHGKHLAQIIEKAIETDREVPLPFICHIIFEVAKGLQYAHTLVDSSTGEPLRLVHRDISPANIMIAFNGAIKIVDFGIAKAANSLDLTKTGVLKGKFKYLAPERITDQACDSRSDLFSLGIIFYELMARQHLFHGESSAEILEKIAKLEQPDITALPDETPSIIRDILLKLLSADPEARFQTAEDLAVAMKKVCNKLFADYTEREFRQTLADFFPDETFVKTEGIAINRKVVEPKYGDFTLLKKQSVALLNFAHQKSLITAALACCLILATIGVASNFSLLDTAKAWFSGVPETARVAALNFNPTSNPSLIAWFDSKNLGAEQQLSNWPAQWPNGLSFRQTQPEFKPTLLVSGDSRLIQFDNRDDRIDSGFVIKTGSLTNGLTLAFVSKLVSNETSSGNLVTLRDAQNKTMLSVDASGNSLSYEANCSTGSCYASSTSEFKQDLSVIIIEINKQQLKITQNNQILIDQALKLDSFGSSDLRISLGNSSPQNAGSQYLLSLAEVMTVKGIIAPKVLDQYKNFLAVRHNISSAIPQN